MNSTDLNITEFPEKGFRIRPSTTRHAPSEQPEYLGLDHLDRCITPHSGFGDLHLGGASTAKTSSRVPVVQVEMLLDLERAGSQVR